MPSPANVAVLLELAMYVANNNVRENVANVKVNVPSVNAEVVQRNTIVLPSSSFSFTAIDQNSGTVVRCTKPLQVDLTTPGGSLQFIMDSVFVITDEITGIVFTNLSTTDLSRLLILQS